MRAGLALTGEAASAQMGQFHLRLAKLSGSPIWAMFTQVLIQVSIDLISGANKHPSDEQVHAQFQHLVRVTEAIEAGEVETAKAELRNFVERVPARFF